MDMKTLREEARQKLKPFCRVCPVCDGRSCAGEVPGIGGVGTGSAFKANLEALGAYRLNMRTLHAAKVPDTSLNILGLNLATPILGAPITGNTYNMGGALSENEWTDAVIEGCYAAGTIACTGDGADPAMFNSGLDSISSFQGQGIAFIKPRSQDEIIMRIRAAEEAGAKAIGVDVDGAGLITMALKGQPVGPKTPAELAELLKESKLPFIIKGIMSVDEAKLAVEIGANAIVVSNHGGRVLDHTPGAAEVLPEIADAVGDRITILADGGVRSGADVLKLLALGAKAVLVGRPLITGAYGGGAEGVKHILDTMTNELKQAMILTGCASVSEVKPSVIY
jgi:4-hydroxymandelate oxidase